MGVREALDASVDPEETKARAVNQAWLVAQRPDLTQHVDADWGTLKRTIAKDLLGRDGPEPSDRDLYAGIAGHLKAQQAKTDAANAMLAKVQDAAFSGEQDWLTAYRSVSGSMTAEGVTPAERDAFRTQAQKVFAHAVSRVTELRPLANMLGTMMANETNATQGQGPTLAWSVLHKANPTSADFIPAIAELPQTDRFLLYRLISQGAKPAEEAPDKFAAQKVAEKFGRQIRDIAVDQIESFEQSRLAHEVVTGEYLSLAASSSWNQQTYFDAPPPNTGAFDDFEGYTADPSQQVSLLMLGSGWADGGMFNAADDTNTYDDFEAYAVGSLTIINQGVGWVRPGFAVIEGEINAYDDFESYSVGSITVLNSTESVYWNGDGSITPLVELTAYDDMESYPTGTIVSLDGGTGDWNGDGEFG